MSFFFLIDFFFPQHSGFIMKKKKFIMGKFKHIWVEIIVWWTLMYLSHSQSIHGQSFFHLYPQFLSILPVSFWKKSQIPHHFINKYFRMHLTEVLKNNNTIIPKSEQWLFTIIKFLVSISISDHTTTFLNVYFFGWTYFRLHIFKVHNLGVWPTYTLVKLSP